MELSIREAKYRKLLRELEPYCNEEDSIRVYKIIGKGQITSFGTKVKDCSVEDVILV